jgi:signal transduction histidine kinase
MTQPGNTELHILHLEDDPKDAELIQAELESNGYSVVIERVMTRDAFTTRLREGRFDLILSDYALPGFDGLSALRIAREISPRVPFISVSGQLGEEAAVESVRGGATDYVLKQRLSRLGPAVRRALLEAEERRRRQRAEEALREKEAQLLQAQKMEPLGRLAGGVAHDFNNLLTVILGYSQVLSTRLKRDSSDVSEVAEITRAAERAATLTRHLLAFSRQQVLQPSVLDLNQLITDMDKMLRRLIGEDIDLVTAPAEGLGRVKADAGQIEQVVMNLVVNARDAMPTGGKLTIETGNIEFSEPAEDQPASLPPGRYVMLAVSDTGNGMTAEIKSRIFEPFFTTKDAGRGTGLGLSMVHGIVQQSGGHVEAYSELGQGTTFKIYLPRVEADVEREGVEGEVTERCDGTETILLVEDDDLVRPMLGMSLRLHGYTALLAADGSEAISLAEQTNLKIDLLITDVVMPLMSGPELAQRVARIRPNLPVLFISGYTDQALIHQGLRRPGTFFLQKPFNPETLALKVRQLLDAGGGDRLAA